MKSVIDNGIKKLSRNRKKRMEGIVKIDDKMKTLLNKIKSEKKRKVKILIKLNT